MYSNSPSSGSSFLNTPFNRFSPVCVFSMLTASSSGSPSSMGVRGDTIRGDTVRGDTVRADTVRSDTVRGDTVRGDTVRGDTVCGDTVRGDCDDATDVGDT